MLALSISHIELNKAAQRTGVRREADHVMLRLNQPVVGRRARPVGLSTKKIEAIVTNIINEEHSIKHIYRFVLTSSSVVTEILKLGRSTGVAVSWPISPPYLIV